MKNKLMTITTQVVSNTKAMKLMAMLLVTGVVLFASGDVAFASNVTFDGVVNPIVGLLNKFVNPLLMLVGAGGSLFCIMLGVKYATAEEPQEREKRKQALKTAIIGFVLIFVLIVALKTSIGPLSQWMNESLKGVNSTPSLNN